MSVNRWPDRLKKREYQIFGIMIIVFCILIAMLGIFQKIVVLEQDLFVTRASREDYTKLWLKKGDKVIQTFSTEHHAYQGFLLQTDKTEEAEGEVFITITADKNDETVYKKVLKISEISEGVMEVKLNRPVRYQDGYTIEISVPGLREDSGFAVLASAQKHGGLTWNGYLKNYSLCLTNHCSYRFQDFGGILSAYILICWEVFYFSFRKKYKKNKKFRMVSGIMFWVVILCMLWSVWYFLQTRMVKGAVQNTETYRVTSDNGNDVYELINGESVFQNFYQTVYKMSGISFLVRGNTQDPSDSIEGDLAVLLVRDSTQDVLYDQRIPIHTCIAGSVDVDFCAEESEPYKESYTLVITYLAADGTDGGLGLVCTGENDDFAQMTVKNRVIETNIVLRERTDNHPYFTSYFNFIFVCLSFAVILYIFFLRYRKISFCAAFACSMLLMGIACSAIFLPYSVEDEHAHYGLAYDVSNRWLGIGEGYEAYDGETRNYTQMMRRDDAQMYLTSGINLDRGEYIWKQLGGKVAGNEMEESIAKYVILITHIFYYPSALGITVARLLSLNTYTLIYMGRVFNFMFMIFMLCMAMRLCPEGKEIIGAVAFLPVSILQMMSYSYDGMIICTIILYTAYIFYLQKKEKIKLNDIIILLMLIFFITTMKGAAYFPVCFLCLVTDKSKFRSRRSFLSFQIGLSIFILAAFAGVYLRFMARKAVQIAIPVQDVILNEYSVLRLLQRPQKLLDLAVNTISLQSSKTVMQLFGSYLTEQYTTPNSLLYLTVICFFLVVRECRMILKKKESVITGTAVLLGFCCVAVGCVSMTLSGLSAIVIRGRYLLPLLFGTGILFSGRAKRHRSDIWLLCLIVISSLVLLHSLNVLYVSGKMDFSYFY